MITNGFKLSDKRREACLSCGGGQYNKRNFTYIKMRLWHNKRNHATIMSDMTSTLCIVLSDKPQFASINNRYCVQHTSLRFTLRPHQINVLVVGF